MPIRRHITGVLPKDAFRDYRDYFAPPNPPRQSRPPPTKVRIPVTPRDDLVIRVYDDWPDVVPITEAELRAVEGHLGDVLDKLFGPRQ